MRRSYAAAAAAKPAAAGGKGAGGKPGAAPAAASPAVEEAKPDLPDEEGYYTIPLEVPSPDKARLRVQIPSGEASSAPPLGVVLGMYQIPLMEFTKEFNTKTADFEKGIPFNTKINKRGKTVTMDIKGPTTTALLDQVCEGGYDELDVCKLWDVIKVKHHFMAKTDNVTEIKSVAKTTLGVIRTLGTKVTGLPFPEEQLRRSKPKMRIVDDEDDFEDRGDPFAEEEDLQGRNPDKDPFLRIKDPKRFIIKRKRS